jgi:chorismate synthase
MSHLRFFTAGESHGPALVVLVEGVPAGLPLLAADLDGDLGRRQQGYGRGGRMKIEQDRATILSGVRGGVTLGSPIALTIANRDHANWAGRMGAEPFAEVPEALVRPRPGHADLAGGQKYNRSDLRDILERASARETASRVAAGAIAKRLLGAVGVEVFAFVRSIGAVACPAEALDLPAEKLRDQARGSEVGCPDEATSAAMKAAIHAASHAGDTLGGIFEVVATGVPVGLGSHVHWDRKLDGRIGQAFLSIQAIKAVSIGDGFEAAALPGSSVHDPIDYSKEHGNFPRRSNHAGGLEGGITNGAPVRVVAAMKPIATLRRALPSVDIRTKESVDAAHERSDICAVLAASVVGEAMLALVLADALLEKFGGDSLEELQRNMKGYQEQLAQWPAGDDR